VSEPAEYPRELERWATLKDGARVRIRPIRPDDAPRLVALYDRLSADTAYQRFFTVLRRLPPDWARLFATVDYHRRLALVAERDIGGEPELIGVGRYEASETSDVPEAAFVVQDEWQGRGLGTALLQDLLRAGVVRGITRFRAYVLADNVRMLDMLRCLTDILESRMEHGVAELVFAPRDAPSGDTR
jgi:GNAT superfamily N-acetyltransferase